MKLLWRSSLAFSFSDNSSANLEWYLRHSSAIPPVVVNSALLYFCDTRVVFSLLFTSFHNNDNNNNNNNNNNNKIVIICKEGAQLPMAVFSGFLIKVTKVIN